MILTKMQQEYLVSKVNEKVNLPILGEKGERVVFEKAIEKILEKLEAELPAEIIHFLNDVSDGFIPGGDGDLEDTIEAMVNFLNKEINIPLMNEKREKKLFQIVIETLFEAMQKGKQLKVA